MLEPKAGNDALLLHLESLIRPNGIVWWIVLDERDHDAIIRACDAIRAGGERAITGRPRPKAELIVRHNNATSFEIYTASADAAAWVQREMPAYGSLYIGTEQEGFFIVSVYPTFNVKDVIQYVEGYNLTPTQSLA